MVNGDNQYYNSDSYGVLYNHNKSVLIQYPAGNENATFKIPDSVITIVNYAFDNCTNLVNIDFPNSVTTIGACAFLNCSNLTNLNISNTVSYIGEGAFCGCESITDIIIPDSVATIEASTFIRCSNLKNITLGKNSSSDPSVATVDENGNIYGAGKGNATITCTVTDEFGNVVSDTCDVEVNYTFGQWLIVIFLFGWIWY